MTGAQSNTFAAFHIDNLGKGIQGKPCIRQSDSPSFRRKHASMPRELSVISRAAHMKPSKEKAD